MDHCIALRYVRQCAVDHGMSPCACRSHGGCGRRRWRGSLRRSSVRDVLVVADLPHHPRHRLCRHHSRHRPHLPQGKGPPPPSATSLTQCDDDDDDDDDDGCGDDDDGGGGDDDDESMMMVVVVVVVMVVIMMMMIMI